MSIVEPACISVVQNLGDDAGIRQRPISNDAIVANPLRLLSSAEGNETSGRFPVDALADQHSAETCYRSLGGIGGYLELDGVCMLRPVVQICGSTGSCGMVTSLSSATGQCAANIGAAAMPDIGRDVPNPVEVPDDLVCLARSPWLSEAEPCGRLESTDGAGTMPARVTDDRDTPVDGQPVVSDIDGLDVHLLGLTLPNGRPLVSDVSFNARSGSLTAIIGPSGAGKTTLAKLVGGVITPTTGQVSFAGHDLHAEYASLRHRIGLVPQDDVVHHQLTVEAALRFAAELRLPRSTTEERVAAVRRVLEELELTSHARTRVDKLSGGQRKRASVAMELLTGPSLLILDEPTTGLDPALDRQVMMMLRRLADAGRVVLVVTHCLTHLDVCDQVLFLAPGAKTAYCGPPGEIGPALGSTNWADIFATVAADPEGVHRKFLTRCRAENPTATLSRRRPGSALRPVPCQVPRQVATLARRQLRLILADRGYFMFLAVLPFILGTLSLLVPGQVGLGTANPRGDAPNEPAQIVLLLNISAVFMGTALTIRDLVGERTIFRREQAVGLSATAYLLAKTAVYAVTAAVQTAVLTTIVVAGKGAPTRGAVAMGNPIVELYLTLATTAAVAAVIGLAMSAAAKSQDQILPMLVVSVMLSIVFCGGLFPVTGRVVLDQLSWAMPARWGFAASAATIDLRTIAPLLQSNETLWSHQLGWWLLDMAALVVLGAVLAGFVRWRIRLGALSPISHRATRQRWRMPLRLELTPSVGYRVTRLAPSE
jgi:ABC-type multidrug transport system ATPase subunit